MMSYGVTSHSELNQGQTFIQINDTTDHWKSAAVYL